MTTINVNYRTPGTKSACPEGCKKHDNSTHKAWADHDARRETAATLLAATKKRCGCGYTGDWSCSVSGTSGLTPVVWAGCPNCRGSAIGAPVAATELRKWNKLAPAEKGRYIAEALVDSFDLPARQWDSKIDLDMATIDSTIDWAAV